MPIPTYRPRSISFFLAPYKDARSELTPSPYNPRTSGVRPGTFAYPRPDAAGPLTVSIHHEAGSPLVQTTNYSIDAGAAGDASTAPAKEPLISQVRVPFAATAALGAGLAGASLGKALGSAQHGARNAAIGGVVAGLAGGGLAWWLATSVKKSIDRTFAAPPSDAPPADAGAYDGNAAPTLDLGNTQTGWPKYQMSTLGMEYTAPPPPSGAPPKPGEIAPVGGGDGSQTFGGFTPLTGDASTASSVDAKPASDEGSKVPWGWIVGGGIAAIVVVGGVAIAASSSGKRRRRARGR